jgi:hypothetical protein
MIDFLAGSIHVALANGRLLQPMFETSPHISSLEKELSGIC